jgi:hypothetical protein
MTDTFAATVIPAKAGIQLVIKLRAADKAILVVLSHCVGLFNCLDSGLRRNDKVVGYAYCL